jgi:hypothetical protein
MKLRSRGAVIAASLPLSVVEWLLLDDRSALAAAQR